MYRRYAQTDWQKTMSNEFQNRNRNFSKTQKKFIPKRDIPSSTHQGTLSNSLRAASARSTTTVDSGSDINVEMGRLKMGENGDWVPINKTHLGGHFISYLPQDEAVASGLAADEGGLDPLESQRVVDLLNRELSRLLKLSPRGFWKEVASDTSLHVFLESFLKFRSRWYDFPYRGAKEIVAGVIVGEIELCRRVFMVLYRISSNREPGVKAADTLSPKDHASLLEDKKLLDLPKLLDICAIYGHENEDLTRRLVMNAIKAQPSVHEEFPVVISHFLSIVQTMNQRCSSSLEVVLSSGDRKNLGSNRLLSDYLEVMDFMNDAVVSLDSFVSAYKHAAVYFASYVEISYGNQELLTTLARLHDSLLPSLRMGFHILEVEDGNQETSSNLLSNAFISLQMLLRRIASFGWKLLYYCYLSDDAFEGSYSLPVSMKMFPANVEEPIIRADILIQSLRDLSGNHSLVPERQTGETFLQNIEKNHMIMTRIELLQSTGWMSMDNEQFQFLAGILSHPLGTNTKDKRSVPFPVRSDGMQADEDTAIIESKICQIKDLFPDYGKGFLAACLEAYNQDMEEVIQRILEGTLHEELQSLDISMERIPPSKSVPPVNKYDKGKGKLVESAVDPPKIVEPAVNYQSKGPSTSSSSSVGRFIRKHTDDLPDSETLNSKNEKELTKTAALISQLEYEDEYDDSFDDLGLSVGDAGLGDSDSLLDKVDLQRGRASDADGGSSTSNAANSKWNSRKKPQFYVKDGKNYSYKVEGSVAVANSNEAALVNQAQKELIHGLGRGGNIPLGAVKRLTESNEEQDGGVDTEEAGGRGCGNGRGRGRSQGRNNYRKDRAMSKHLSGLPGRYNS